MANDDNVERPSIWPFYLIVADHDRGLFSVEGPMTSCGWPLFNAPATGSAADYQKTHKLAGVPPGQQTACCGQNRGVQIQIQNR